MKLKLLVTGLAVLGGVLLLNTPSTVSAMTVQPLQFKALVHYHRHVTARGVARRTTRRVVRRNYYY